MVTFVTVARGMVLTGKLHRGHFLRSGTTVHLHRVHMGVYICLSMKNSPEYWRCVLFILSSIEIKRKRKERSEKQEMKAIKKSNKA
jgi:hypothetical protein